MGKQKTWINDSKATNIEATEAALRSMTEPVTLLLGGAGKQGADYTQLRDLLQKNTSRDHLLWSQWQRDTFTIIHRISRKYSMHYYS